MKWNSGTARAVSKGRLFMDRIICDICGSEYAGTADVCPICGYPRQGDEKAAVCSGEITRAKVRGGRFSSKNVRKREKARRQAAREPSNRGLWITIILLLIAIILVAAYIVMRFWDGRDSFTGTAGTTDTVLPTTTAAPVETTVPCEGLSLDAQVVEFGHAQQQMVLAVKKTPADTTDPVLFASADPSIAQVSGDGVITAVGPGQTVITVTCGTVTKECTVICWFLSGTSAPTETTLPPETTQATEPAVLKLDHEDVSLFQPGEAFTIKVLVGDTYIGRSQAEWSSSDPNVASVEKGVVTAVGPGVATITAKYQGQKAVCIVRCQFRDSAWRASITDVTLAVGESVPLSVVNGSGERADVVWAMDKEGIVSMQNGTVTALASGTVRLYATIDGVKLWCIVRVK